jgi:hypothetical protein
MTRVTDLFAFGAALGRNPWWFLVIEETTEVKMPPDGATITFVGEDRGPVQVFRWAVELARLQETAAGAESSLSEVVAALRVLERLARDVDLKTEMLAISGREGMWQVTAATSQRSMEEEEE